MNIDRAIEIIDAYGADPARWPDEERLQAQTLAVHPRVAAALADAASLDRDLALWASRPVPLGDPLGAAAVALAARPARVMPWRWAAGGGIAAALLAGFLLITPQTVAVKEPSVSVASSVSDEQAFASLFTPTPDEENSI